MPITATRLGSALASALALAIAAPVNKVAPAAGASRRWIPLDAIATNKHAAVGTRRIATCVTYECRP